MDIKLISPADTYSLRHKVLRPHQTINDCMYPTDNDENAFHLGAYVNGELISVASYYNELDPAFKANNAYRLRGMATLPEYRGKGAGSALVADAIKIIKERNGDLLWCNARTSAADYYQKLGFDQQGEIFDLPPIGPHKLMFVKVD
jgi:ribosomal protein S18 acetylase RimI-like enzyme